VLAVNFEKIPTALKERRQWVLWRLEMREGQRTKVPYQVNAPTRMARSNDPATWASFESAREAARQFGEFDGIGFMFSATDPFVGIDLDHCFEADGTLSPWARTYVDMVPSYWERSQSGSGLHGIVSGALPPEHRREGPVEMYEDVRLFATTGDHLAGTAAEIQEGSAAVLRMHSLVFRDRIQRSVSRPRDPGSPPFPLPLSDEDLLDKARRAANGAKFSALYDAGDVSGHGGDDSRADMALCVRLAWWTGADPARVERLFAASALYREEKVKSNRGYVGRTAAQAVAWVGADCYRPEAPPRDNRRSPAFVNGTEPCACVDDRSPGPEPEADARRPKPAAEPANDRLAQEWAAGVQNQFVFVEGDEWRCYRENRWRLVSETTVEHSIYRWLHEERLLPSTQVKKSRIVEIRFLAQSLLGDPDLGPLPMARFNADPDMLPLANLVLNVRTRETVPHRPDQYHTYCLPYDYDPAAECPQYEAFQRQVMIDETGQTSSEWCDLLEQWMGYCLIPDCSAEGTLVNIGEGGNGKGVWAKVLEALVGDENCGSINLRTLELKEDLVMANLHGKLVAFINEPTRAQLTGCSGSIKAIASGDKVEGKRLYHASFYYRPHLRLVVSCNDMMETKDLSGGFFRRLLIVGWNYRPPTPDRRLAARLLQELPGILNLALAGLDRLRGAGFEFPEPAASRALKADYWHSQDSAKQFLEACCDCDAANPDWWSVPAELHRRYSTWCKEAGYQPLNVDAFGKHLTRRLGYPPKRARRVGSETMDVRYGIRLKSGPVRESGDFGF
jgi:putative DNA primase/helicase